MKLYACFTQSHMSLLMQHFLPSLPDEFGRELRELPQHSPSGAFASSGFQATCLDKVNFILDAIHAETEPFLFSDVDVRFYGPVVEDMKRLLGDADMAFQWDGEIGRECTGFMVIRPCKLVRVFWEGVLSFLASTSDPKVTDQDAAHAMLGATPGLTTTILPERYWTVGRNDRIWNPGDQVNPPADLLAHHANWTVGVENKLKLLDAVEAEHERQTKGEAR